MRKNVLTVISVIVFIVFLALIARNLNKGYEVKEIHMPGGGSLKFEDKKDPASPSSLNYREVQGEAGEKGAETGDEKTPKHSKGEKPSNDYSKPPINNAQRTTGDQSPAINAGRDATIIYEKK